MPRILWSAVAALSLAALAPAPAAAGPITYTIINYPEIQAGSIPGTGNGTVSGTITTDGTIGPLHLNNIVSWQITIFNPFNNLSSSTSSDGNVAYLFEQGGSIIATATHILFPDPGSNGQIGINLQGSNGTQYTLINLNNSSVITIGSNTDGPTVFTVWENNPPTFPTRPLQFARVRTAEDAAVPEPATLVLLLAGIGGWAGARRRSRRKARAS